MAVRPLLLAACAWLCLASNSTTSSTAYAFCRTHTKDPAASDCPEDCAGVGLPLAWSTPKLTYTFNEAGFPGLSNAELRSIFSASFQTWENVRCRSETTGLDIRAKTATTALTIGPEADEPNDNVIMHFSAQKWAAMDMPPHAFAITAVWFDAERGDILGADMMFNGRMDPFGECADDGCTSTGPSTDLRNVATHEIGHFLGLSHSDVPNSTMWCDAEAKETSKRSLAEDDVDGLCAIYPPSVAFQNLGESKRVSRSCALAPTGSDSWAGPAASLLLAVGLCLRRRRRLG